MKKYLYLSSDIFYEKNPTNGAVILTYDTDSKQLSVIDYSENKKEEKIDVGQKGGESSLSPEALENLVSKAELEEVKNEFTGKIKDFLKIQGSCSLDELAQKDKVKGHMWQVDDKEYVYNGSDWVEIGFEIDLSEYAKKSELFSGSYNDLSDKPEIPTKVSDLNNDAGFISNFTEEDPLFAAQSGQFATKNELTNLISDELDPKFAEVSGNFALKSEIPTKVSDLENDSNFLTEHQSLENYATKAEISNFISEEIDPAFAEASGQFVIKSTELFGTFPESGYTKTTVNNETTYVPNGEIVDLNTEVITITGDSFSDNSKTIKNATLKLTNHNIELIGPNISTSKLDRPAEEESLAHKLFTVNIGSENIVSGMAAMAIGKGNKAVGHYSFVHGYNTYAQAAGSHAEGQGNYANAGYSHVEGQNTETNALYSHTEGYRAKAYATHSHAEGGTYTFNGTEYHPETYGKKSHAEGAGSKTYGEWSHAEGCMTAASGTCAHSEGYFTKAIGGHSHAEGYYCATSGDFSHAIGHTAITDITASGSFAEGFHTEAVEAYSHVEGKYNVPLAGYQHIVGGGSSDNNRKNIQTLDWNGNQVNAGNMTAKDFLFEGDSETLKAKIEALLNRVAELEAIVSGLQQ